MRVNRSIPLACILSALVVGLAAEAAASALWDLRPSVGIDMAAPVAAALAPTPSHDLAVGLIPGLPAFKLRTILVGVHLAGLCIGLGSVFVLDVLLVKASWRGFFHARNTNMIAILSQTTTLGLALLWSSGLGFLLLYLHDSPELLDNPKLVAKLAVVAVLTVNGILIHRFCLPRLTTDFASSMFSGVSFRERVLMIFCGSLSSASWVFAAFLGTAKELNKVVPVSVLLGLWAVAVLAAFALSLTGASTRIRSQRSALLPRT